MEEILKEILGEHFKDGMSKEDVEKALAETLKTDKEEKTSENTVPLEKYTNIEKQLKDLKKQIADKEKQEKAKQDADKTLEEQLQELKAMNDALVKEKNTSILKSQLIGAGLDANEIDNVLSKINIENEDEANEIGATLTTLLKSSIDAGVKAKMEEGMTNSGKLPGGEQATTPTKADFEKMSYTEMLKFSETNPTEFKQFMGE